MAPRIHCDACNAQIDEQNAVARADEDGEVFYFCTEQCAETAERLDPDRELEPIDMSRR
jgi:YHS domain-containing protein